MRAPEPGKVTEAPQCDGAEEAFLRAWPALRAALEARDSKHLLSQDLGLYVIDNPGAFSVPRHFDDLDAAGEVVPRLRTEHLRVACVAPRPGARPRYSCEEDRWSSEGCVVNEGADLGLVRHIDVASRNEVLPADMAGRREQASRVEGRIERSVYQTDPPLGLYFGRDGCDWVLLAVDAVEPCSA